MRQESRDSDDALMTQKSCSRIQHYDIDLSFHHLSA